MKTYLPLVLIVGGVHLALIFGLTLLSNLPPGHNALESGPQLPAEALQGDCALHHVARTAGPVQVTYGNLAVAREYLDARAKLFPNAWYYIEGGTEMTPGSPRQVTVKYCPNCRVAEQRWRAQFARR